MMYFPVLMLNNVHEEPDGKQTLPIDHLSSLMNELNPKLDGEEGKEWEAAKKKWEALQKNQNNPSSNMSYYQDVMDVSARIFNRWSYAWTIFVAQAWKDKNIRKFVEKTKERFIERTTKARKDFEKKKTELKKAADQKKAEEEIAQEKSKEKNIYQAAKTIEQLMLRKLINTVACMPFATGMLDDGQKSGGAKQNRTYEDLVPLNIILEVEFEDKNEEAWDKNSIWEQGEWKELPMHKVIMRVPKGPKDMTDHAIAISRYAAHLRSHPFTFTC